MREEKEIRGGYPIWQDKAMKKNPVLTQTDLPPQRVNTQATAEKLGVCYIGNSML